MSESLSCSIGVLNNSSLSDLSIRSHRMREVGLSTEQAMDQFASIVRMTVNSAHPTKTLSIPCRILWLKSAMLFGTIMLVYQDAVNVSSKLVLILKISIILFLGLWELYMCGSEWYRRRMSLIFRIQRLLTRTLKVTSEGGFSYGMPLRIPLLPKHKFVRVYRDGMLRLCPGSLIVTGDVIQLLEGEPEPCRLERVATSNTIECIALESPIVKIIDGYIESINYESKRSPSGLNWYRLSIKIIILIVSIMYFYNFIEQSHLHDILLFLNILRSNIFGLALKIWGNTRMQLVVDALKRSKTPYDEALDADEFDEDAPPPSKDIFIRPIDVLWKVVSLNLSGSDFFQQPDLVALLGGMSVICMTDREGPISLTLPSPEEIIQIGSREKLVLMGVEEWSLDHTKFTKMIEQNKEALKLKPLGLATLSCTECYRSSGILTGVHRRFIYPENYKRYLNSVALQSCQCMIGKSMGLDLLRSNRLEFLGEYWIKPECGDPIIIFSYIDKEVAGVLRCFAVGSIVVLLDKCAEYYVDGKVIEMTPSIRRALIESEEGAEGRDEEYLGYAFQTLFLDSFPDYEAIFNSLCSNIFSTELEEAFGELCFLGSLTMTPQPREDMQEFIDDIMNAGIRFVYIGEEGERQAKTLGSRLGLETDWNGCILLDSNTKVNYSDLSDIKARLPVGVNQIREHLKYVDDIPLHVSVFAGASSDSAAEMVKIYQEHGEIVCVTTSALNPHNFLAANHADLCISMDPMINVPGGKALWEIASEWHSLSASFSIPFESSPYILTDLVKEARTLLKARLCSETFLRYASLAIVLSHQFKLLFLVLTLAICISSVIQYDSDVLKLMPEKATVKDSPRDARDMLLGWFVFYAVILFSPNVSILSLLLMGIAHLHPVHSIWAITIDYYKKHRLATICLSTTLTACIVYRIPYNLVSVLPATIHEIGKYFYRTRFTESQKRSKLEFSTRLGMHSPI